MKRRHFSLAATALAAAGGLPRAAWAQAAAPVEDRDFVRLKQPAPLAVPPGKVVVTEFFWYGCPHCHVLEPALEAWVKRLPADVQFRRVPYDFDGARQRDIHKRIYSTWETMGLVDAMHQKTWDRFHVQRKPINSEDDMLAFAKESGLDVAKVKEAWNGFGTQVRVRQATQVCEQYDIHETPVIAVQDRYKTSPAQVGGNDKALLVTDGLIGMARRRT